MSDSIDIPKLINELYQLILERSVDPSGLATHKQMYAQGGVVPVIKALLHSTEFIGRKTDQRKKIPQPTANELSKEINDFCFFYTSLNKRNPNTDDIIEFLKSGRKTRELQHEQMLLGLKNPESMKVLITGAYGNGNMGDAYQALALEQILVKKFSIPEENIFACSQAGDNFPFSKERIISMNRLSDFAFINSFGMIVIGGGGIFACIHKPFCDADGWSARVHVPIVIYACGADHIVAELSRNLLDKAVEVSGRDEPSIEAIREYREDCVYEKDPILAQDCLEALERYDIDSENLEKVDTPYILWILKYPYFYGDEEALTKIQYIISQKSTVRHVIAAMEPARDRELEKWFPNQVIYCDNLRQINQLIKESISVVSMRYHGAIFALLNGKKVVGLSQTKIKQILTKPSVYIDTIEDLINETLAICNYYICIHNPTPCQWTSEEENPIQIACHWLDETWNMLQFDAQRFPLPAEGIPPQETHEVEIQVTPPEKPGRYHLMVTLVQTIDGKEKWLNETGDFTPQIFDREVEE